MFVPREGNNCRKLRNIGRILRNWDVFLLGRVGNPDARNVQWWVRTSLIILSIVSIWEAPSGSVLPENQDFLPKTPVSIAAIHERMISHIPTADATANFSVHQNWTKPRGTLNKREATALYCVQTNVVETDRTARTLHLFSTCRVEASLKCAAQRTPEQKCKMQRTWFWGKVETK